MKIEELFVMSFLLPFIVVCLVHPYVLKYALKSGWTDKPNARKLQKNPIPVLGGLAVFIGVLVGVICTWLVLPPENIIRVYVLLASFLVMLLIGMLDDKLGLTASLRLIIEAIVVLCMIFFTGNCVDNLQGALSLHSITWYIAVPFSLIVGLGLINAINMIDGVNGLSTGFCIVATMLFAILFNNCGYHDGVVWSLIFISATIPFFIHNTLGKKSRMFIGDAGTMMYGCLMSSFVFYATSSSSLCIACYPNLSMAAFTLAVLAVPVFDTLRVMIMRILHGRSPMSPDKTHLHHLFIEVGYSHICTTMSILILDLLVVLAWFISYKLGANALMQILVSGFFGLLNTTGFYVFVRNLNHQGKFYLWLRSFASKINIENTPTFQKISKFVDIF